ncbi:MAG: hypothetical protein H7X80_01835, partial [bacterium]|nr:hypothetical protein [Candidatus Kapabacteria bacterium]
MTMAFPESAGERIQRSLNDAKRNELSDRFGGVFLAGNMPLPADVESEFLQRIEEFELKWAAHDVTTVRAFIGDPPVKLSSEIAPDELQSELEHLMSTLDENDIQLDFAERPSDAEVYRFIVEELLDHEIDDIRVPGMVCHFIYEEFHPNASLDVRLACEWFVERMLSHDEHLLRSLERCEHAGADGNVFDFTDLRAAVADVHARIATVIDHSTAVIASDVGDCAACVDVEIRLKGFEAGSLNELNAEWKSRL